MRGIATVAWLVLTLACSSSTDPAVNDTALDTVGETEDSAVAEVPDPQVDTGVDTADAGEDTATFPLSPVTSVTTAQATAALEAAVPGLLFLSESDSPVDVVVLVDPAALPSLPTLPALVAPIWTSTSPPALADRDVEVRDLAAVFDPLTVEQPWWDDFYRTQAIGWSAIRATMETLDGARVWRLGRDIGGGEVGGSIEVYVLGGTAEGDVVGVHFVAVET